MKHIWDEPDLVLALLGLVGGCSAFEVYSMLAGRPAGVLFLVIGLSCLAYLSLSRKRDLGTTDFGMDLSFSPKLVAVFDLLFVFLLICSVYFSMEDLYLRNVAYFVSLWGAILLTMIEICLFVPTEEIVADVLLKVLVIAAVLRWVPYISFPGPVGVDPWWHTFFTRLLYDSSRIPSGYLYSFFPVQHLVTATLKYVSSLDSLKIAQLLSVSLFEVVSLIALFGIGELVLGRRLGLVVALIAGVSDWHIQWGTALIPTSLGLGFFTIVVFLVLKGRDRSQLATTALLMGTLILAHTISSFILLVTLASMFVAPRLYQLLLKKAPERLVSFSLVLLFAIGVFGYWSYGSSFLSGEVLSIERTFSGLEALTYATAPPPSLFLDYWSRSQLQIEVDNMGMYLLYWLGILGSLVWLSRHNSNSTAFCLILAAGVLFAISYGSTFLGARLLVPDRWVAFIYILLAAPAVKGLQVVSGLAKNKKVGLAVATTMVLALSIMMTTDSTANLGSSALFDGQRFALSIPEIHASEFLRAKYQGVILTDNYYIDSFSYEANWEIGSTYLINGTGELVRDGLIAVRKSSYSSPMIFSIGDRGEVLATLTEYFRNDLDNSENKIFDNGGVEAWLPHRS
jgi:hypothetical protein